MRLLFTLLFSSLTFAQISAIKIEIDSVKYIDSIPSERTFTINYHIENLTDNEISFFLNPKSIIPNSRASMSRKVIYNIYQYNEKLNLDDIFTDRRKLDFGKQIQYAKTEEERRSLMNDYLKKDLEIDFDSLMKYKKNETGINKYFSKSESISIMKSIIKLKPKESKFYSAEVIWDKKRYFKIDDNEFYLNEDMPHFIELTINLMKEEFKDKIINEEFEKIIINPNFISGWFISNKVEINFKE
jgi:hypothetical protein